MEQEKLRKYPLELNCPAGKVIIQSEELVEARFAEGVTVTPADTEVINQFLNQNLSKPYSVLVNTNTSYSFSFEAATGLGDHPLERKVAVVVEEINSKIPGYLSLLESQKFGFPDKEIRLFYDRNKALRWLEDI